MSETLTEVDEALLRCAFQLAQKARDRGDRPFGTVMAAPGGRIMAEGSSTQEASGGGLLARADLATLPALQPGLSSQSLVSATIYCSGELYPMCAAAIHLSEVGRVVYGLSISAIRHLRCVKQESLTLALTCRQVLNGVPQPPEIIGPCLEDEASVAHPGYWIAAPDR